MAEPPILLVTGATGSVGPAVVRAGLGHGFHVRTLTRRAPPPGLLPGTVDAHIGDIGDPVAVRAALTGVDCIVHMAALLHTPRPDPRTVAAYGEVNSAATRRLMELARVSGARRLVFFSTIAVYGTGRGELLTEDSPARPESPYAHSKIAAEEAVLELSGRDGLTGVVLRVAAVYGPRVKGNYLAMLGWLMRWGTLPLRPGDNRRTLVFEDDAAAAALLAARQPRAAGRVFNVTDGQVHTVRDIVGAMCHAIGRPPAHRGLPPAVLRLLLASIPAGDRLRAVRHARETFDKFQEDLAVDGHRIERELGFRSAVPLRDGWIHTVSALRDRRSHA